PSPPGAGRPPERPCRCWNRRGRTRSACLLGLHSLCELGKDLVEVSHDAEVREFEDRRVGVLVDRDDVLRGLHPHLVLDRAGDPRGQIQLRRDRLAGLSDLRRVRVAATALLPPKALARSSANWKPSALPSPRPPAIRMLAPSMSTSAPRCSPRETIVACEACG